MSDSASVVEFKPWPKIARLNRDIIITEKIDGTNSAVGILDDGTVYAQSRKRIITPEDDNFGFAGWVAENAETLTADLGPGLHFGEWWGRGIQRGYGQTERFFSLFNTIRYSPLPFTTRNLTVVPVIYQGPFSTAAIESVLSEQRDFGSYAARGYRNPEGIVVFHTAANQMFKVTLQGDEAPKSATAA